MREATCGIVLAGGRSTRLAGVVPPAGKAALEVGGQPLLGRILATLDALVSRRIVVAAARQPLPDLPADVRVVRDTRDGAGPLAGLADGLAWLQADAARGTVSAVVVLSCDVPLVSPEVLRVLLRRLHGADGTAGPSWVVPEVGGHLQVLVSVLRPGLLAAVEAHLAAGRRDPRSLVDRLRRDAPGSVAIVPEADVRRVDPALASFRDVDTPGDLEELRRIDAGRPPT